MHRASDPISGRVTRSQVGTVTATLALLLASCSGGGGDDQISDEQAGSTLPPVTTTSSTVSTSSSTVTSTTAPDAQLTAASRLRLDGIGPVRVGMTLAEASRVTGKRLSVDADSGPDAYSCGFARPPGGPDVAFMVIDGRIRRVDVGERSRTATVSGVRVGASETEVGRTYKGRINVRPHPYRPTGHYLVYESPEPSQRGLLLIFETDGAKVTSFRAGERGAVEAPEGCA